MPRPTLQELRDDAAAKIVSRTGKTRAIVRYSPERALAEASASVAHGIHGRIDRLAITPTPDDPDAVLRWATLRGLTRWPAKKAHGSVTFSANPGGEIEVGAGMVAPITERRYIVTAGDVEDGGSLTVAVESVLAGAAGELGTGAQLELSTSIPGVHSIGTVVAPGLLDGADEESIEDLSGRVRAEFQQPHVGGGPGDYERWALAVPGVTRAKVLPKFFGLGTVLVLIASDGGVTPEPSPELLEDALDYIAVRAPPSAEVFVQAPTLTVVDVTIRDLLPNNQSARDAVELQLRDLFRRRRSFGGTVTDDQISGAVSAVAGYISHDLDAPLPGVIASGVRGLLVLGTVAFVTS